jgi:hypothetical protein
MKQTTESLSSWLSHIFDNRIFRIIFGTIVGVPLTVLALACLPDGIFLAIGGLQKGDPLLSSLSLVIVLGLAGLAGAWRRILKTHETMTSRQRYVVRVLLGCGVISSTCLAVVASTFTDTRLLVAVPLLVLSASGAVLILATPR